MRTGYIAAFLLHFCAISALAGCFLRGSIAAIEKVAPVPTRSESILCEAEETACYQSVLCRTCIQTATIPQRPTGAVTQKDINDWFYGIDFVYPDECNYLDGKSAVAKLLECRYDAYTAEAGLPPKNRAAFANKNEDSVQFFQQISKAALPVMILLFVGKSRKGKSALSTFSLFMKSHSL